MTSLVTTLTLMMTFNAIVFNGVTTVWAVDDTECGLILHKTKECVKSKWKLSSEDTTPEVKILRTCCLGFKSVCVANQLVREEVCKRSQDIEKSLKTVNKNCNQYKDCSQLKTYPMDESCHHYKKYINCELKNRSHHISCGPLLVITSIAIVIVIQLFS